MTSAGLDPSGPRVVALGGGHGLSTTLRAVRTYASEVTAVVSVADDGGSSGRLRDALGIPAPGDLRKSLVALGSPGVPLCQALEHRFDAGELAGHALGNLLIAGLASTLGSFTAALEEVSRLVGAVGRVLPATTEPVVLKAEAASGTVEGQVAVANARRIAAVSLVPSDPEAPPAAVDAIVSADQVVIGPGSLFTSVIAALAVPALRQALEATSARRVYVANLRQQPPETEGFTVADHVGALAAHGVDPDVVLYDPCGLDPGDIEWPSIAADLAAPGCRVHDAAKLAGALAGLVG